MDDLPFGKPVLLHSFHGTDLHNPHGLDKAQCTANATKVSGALYASVILHRINDNSVAIQTYRNGRFLAVDDSGDCRFVKEAIKSLPDKCKFFVEMRVISKSPNHLFFISRSKGTVLQAHSSGSVRCENTNRLEWESWAIVELDGAPCCCATEDPATEPVDSDVPKTRLGWIKFLVEQKNSADEIRKLLEIIYPGESSSASVPEKVVPKKLI